MKESIFDVSTETLYAASFWINYVTSRKRIPVDDMPVANPYYCISTMEFSINFINIIL